MAPVVDIPQKTPMARRAVIIVLDSVGIGEMPDSAAFGDAGADTLGNISRAFPDGLKLPNMGRLGLGNIAELRGVPTDFPLRSAHGADAQKLPPPKTPPSATGRLPESSLRTRSQRTRTAFPARCSTSSSSRSVSAYWATIPASGTEIIRLLGDEHVANAQADRLYFG